MPPKGLPPGVRTLHDWFEELTEESTFSEIQAALLSIRPEHRTNVHFMNHQILENLLRPQNCMTILETIDEMRFNARNANSYAEAKETLRNRYFLHETALRTFYQKLQTARSHPQAHPQAEMHSGSAAQELMRAALEQRGPSSDGKDTTMTFLGFRFRRPKWLTKN